MRALLILIAWLLPAAAHADDLYTFKADQAPRWASPENAKAQPGAGGQKNRGAKGHAFETIAQGQSLVLADITGPGIIDRMWLTLQDRSPERLRSLRLDIYWDGAKTPAVSVPFGDFFLQNAGQMVTLDTALFSSPEGRSFISYIPMPFRKGARIVVTNESATEVPLFFYDVDYRAVAVLDDALYFHAWWHRDRATELGKDFEILPKVTGRGRFLGASVNVQSNTAYEKTWWGEGEVKIWLDGDTTHPTLNGTGAEDYAGTGWGMGAYINRYQGAPVADETTGRWSFYRFHIPDPVFFAGNARVTLQQIGGAMKPDVIRLQKQGAKLIPVTIDPGGRKGFAQLLDSGKPLSDPSLPDGWTNFYRSDDVSAVAWFYLDRPENGLPPLAPVADRTADLRKPASK
ncbi:hypothetical protein ABAC460_19125 [Asticcacaulis sp. AC460]|uniref:glycoside hydrolase family 172 protein n=1 Tax=Asticcacaulis sp. AC460 TaxID=1282360 RepID=UPI0003C3EB6E|nr:glycoside hydrolase family 172 protein [Asticcacaulis sp. AC460]ESQ87440.1 hypothetical protein ABAC460_19125 [Asticcacaulis sp. AC460]